MVYGQKVGELPEATRTGYSFLGWKNPSTGYYLSPTTTYNVANDATYYGDWSANSYKITFDANGGTIGGSSKKEVSAKYDEIVGSKVASAGTPSMTGYTFAGWWTHQIGGTQITSSTTTKVTGNVTYYAHWTAITYKIRFHHNVSTDYYDGEVKCGDTNVAKTYYYEQEMTYGVAKHLLSNKYTRKHVVSLNKRPNSESDTMTISPEGN